MMMMMEPCSLVSNTVTATETRHIAHEYRNTTKNDLNDKYRYVNFFSDRFRVVFIIDVSSTGYDDDDDDNDDDDNDDDGNDDDGNDDDN